VERQGSSGGGIKRIGPNKQTGHKDTIRSRVAEQERQGEACSTQRSRGSTRRRRGKLLRGSGKGLCQDVRGPSQKKKGPIRNRKRRSRQTNARREKPQKKRSRPKSSSSTFPDFQMGFLPNELPRQRDRRTHIITAPGRSKGRSRAKGKLWISSTEKGDAMPKIQKKDERENLGGDRNDQGAKDPATKAHASRRTLSPMGKNAPPLKRRTQVVCPKVYNV